MQFQQAKELYIDNSVIIENNFVRQVNQTKRDMKFKFGYYNGLYWLIISTAEQLVFAFENLAVTNRDIDMYLEVLKNYGVIYLNENGGYHTGRIQDVHTDKTQIIERTNKMSCLEFPTDLDRIEVLKQELIEAINEIEKENNLPLTTKITLS